MSEVVDVAMEGIFNGFTSAEFGQGVTTAVVGKFIELMIDAPSIEDKVSALEQAIASLDRRVAELEQSVRREALVEYLSQILEGRSRAAPIRGTMRTLMSLLKDAERYPGLVRPHEVDAALIDMENELNTLADESIYTYTIFTTTSETRFDPRFTLPSYIQGMNLYVSALARWFPSRLGEERVRDVILFHAARLEYFVSVIKSQIVCTAEAFTAEEPRSVPGTRLTHYVEMLVVRNAAMCKADGYMNRRVPTDWRQNFEPRIAGPFSVRTYNELRKERWTETERSQWYQSMQGQIPVVLRMNEYRRLALDDMLENAAMWRYTVAAAVSLHPLGLSVAWENGRGIVIRFNAFGFNTTQPVRLYRYPDFTGEDGRSLPVNQPVEIIDPFPFQPGEPFRYEVTVWGDDLINNRLMKLSRDAFEFRHPVVVWVQDWRTRDDVLNGRPDMVDIPSAEEIGLRVNFHVVQDYGYAPRDVIAIEPPVGTLVVPGTEITITVNDG